MAARVDIEPEDIERVVLHETVRACGYRRPGKNGVGVYLTGPVLTRYCGRLPLPLHSCPVCGGGIHRSRGWTWIEPRTLWGVTGCDEPHCSTCLAGKGMPEGKHGLLWAGERYWPTPQHWLFEAQQLGASRRLASVPRGFELGRTVVYMAHAKTPRGHGVFAVWKPLYVDLVVEDEQRPPETALRIAQAVGDGARIVRIVSVPVQTELELGKVAEAAV